MVLVRDNPENSNLVKEEYFVVGARADWRSHEGNPFPGRINRAPGMGECRFDMVSEKSTGSILEDYHMGHRARVYSCDPNGVRASEVMMEMLGVRHRFDDESFKWDAELDLFYDSRTIREEDLDLIRDAIRGAGFKGRH